jgi:hypothetical protein
VLLVGVSLSLGAPLPSRADEPTRPAKLWRAFPLRPNADDAVSGDTAGGYVPRSVRSGTPGAVAYGGDGADTAANSRLTLQLGMLIALLYVAFLCVWFSMTRHVPSVAAGRHPTRALRRVRASWAATVADASPLARTRSQAQRRRFTPATASSLWTCEIVWRPGPGRGRFQAVIGLPDGRTRPVVAESKGVPWPPKDVGKPPTRELEAALGSLVASIVAAGWEPVQSAGAWSERRFVWRHDGEPPTKLERARS